MTLSKHLKERASQEKKVHVSFAHIDMCDGDIVAAILLSQIVYWFTPNKEGAHKVTIRRGSDLWLAKKDSDWKNEIRLTVDQARRARSVLTSKGYIKCETHKYKGVPQIHIALVENVYMNAWNTAVDSVSKPIRLGPEPESDSGQNPSQVGLEPESLYSEITAENTTKTTNEPAPFIKEYQQQYFKRFSVPPRITLKEIDCASATIRDYGLTDDEAVGYMRLWGEQWKDDLKYWPASLLKFNGELLTRLDKIKAIAQDEDAELLAEMRRLFPDYVPKSQRQAV